jgi:hypothetical protein
LICIFVAAAAWLHVYRTADDARLDFPQFYIAAHIPLPQLYDYRSFQAAGHSLLAAEDVSYYPPYVRPAVFALPLRCLRYFSYRTAFGVWAAFQMLLLALSAVLIRRTWAGPPTRWLLPFLAFFPAFYGIIFGQDGAVMLLILAAALCCLATGRSTLGGVLLGVGFYKFNLIVLVPVYLIISRQWRAFTGFTVTACLAAALSAVLAPAAGYLHLLRHIPEIAQGFLPENMIGLRGLAATLGMPWLYWAGVATIAPLTLIGAARSDPRTGLTIAVTGSMLCAYHINGYDGTLAAIPLVALMAAVQDHAGRALLAAAVIWLGRPPLWLTPLILIAILAALIALPKPSAPPRRAGKPSPTATPAAPPSTPATQS